MFLNQFQNKVTQELLVLLKKKKGVMMVYLVVNHSEVFSQPMIPPKVGMIFPPCSKMP